MKYAIAAGHQATTQTAEEILKAGGNAYDACVASFFTACVAEPAMASLGAGCLIVHKTQQGGFKFVDGFCDTPSRKLQEHNLIPIEVRFDDEVEFYYGGKDSVAIPGVVKSLFHLIEKYGSIPMRELVQPAMRLANEGIELNEFERYDLQLLSNVFQIHPLHKEMFFVDGEIKPVGAKIGLPGFSDCLDFLSREGERAFYEGEILDDLFKEVAESSLSKNDFESFRIFEKDALSYPFKNGVAYLPNIPSKGGYILAALLNEEVEGDFLKRNYEVRHCDADLERLKKYSGIAPRTNNDIPSRSGTSHLNIVDRNDNMISMSFSIGEGSGVVIGSTGIHMNNMLGEPSLLPKGLHSWIPNTRLTSMMTPTMVKHDQGILILGSGGADRIPYMLAQTIENRLNKNLPLAESVERGRFNITNDTLHSERDLENTLTLPMKVWENKSLYFGGVHAVEKNGMELNALGDFRRHGHAIVGD